MPPAISISRAEPPGLMLKAMAERLITAPLENLEAGIRVGHQRPEMREFRVADAERGLLSYIGSLKAP
jgi:hypothetical protein